MVEGWSLDDLQLCLAVLARIRRSSKDTPSGLQPSTLPASAVPVTATDELLTIARTLQLAHATYYGSASELGTAVRDFEYVDGEWRADARSLRPSYFVGWCEVGSRWVLAVRGTYSVDDALVASIVVPEPFMDGYTHRGAPPPPHPPHSSNQCVCPSLLPGAVHPQARTLPRAHWSSGCGQSWRGRRHRTRS